MKPKSKTLAYLGPEGTHTEQACIAYNSSAIRIPFPSIRDAVNSIVTGEAEECMVPIENSLAGSVNETLDVLIFHKNIKIKYELIIPINHYLITKAQVAFNDIKYIYSHPQAIAQCKTFISENLPNAKITATMSTALAVKQMLDTSKNESAAIGTKRSSILNNAVTIGENIQDNKSNSTRFAILSNKDSKSTGDDKTSICFELKSDRPGILYESLGEFASRDINLSKIESRPTGESLGRYMFLIDLLGHRDEPKVQLALSALKKSSSMFRLFGSYPRFKINEDKT